MITCSAFSGPTGENAGILALARAISLSGGHWTRLIGINAIDRIARLGGFGYATPEIALLEHARQYPAFRPGS
jgi:hypothetical protein